LLVEFLATGLDPEKATLYIQSDIPEVTELYLLLNMNAYLGELERVTSFKDKARKQPENINAGLLTYPTLMSADVIIHKASKVPVGKDQEQNLEMMRTFARRFNRMYNEDYFPVPVAYNFGQTLVKIPGLDGSGKMGKSEGEGNAIYLVDEPNVIKKKIMRAVTDSGPTEMNQAKPEPIENIFGLMKVVSTPETVAYFDEQYNKCEIRYGDMKKQLAEDMNTFVVPFREKIKELSANEQYLSKVAKMGADKARESASSQGFVPDLYQQALKTIKEVREIIGFKKF